jgi:hypothetical protein
MCRSVKPKREKKSMPPIGIHFIKSYVKRLKAKARFESQNEESFENQNKENAVETRVNLDSR